MIASLPMYWRAETAAGWRAFWAMLQTTARAEGLSLPDLTPPEDIPDPWTDHWLRRDLALSMTCGLPFRTALKGKVTYIGTLDFDLGKAPGYYHSQVLVRAGCDPAGPLQLAYNSGDSQSGWAVTQSAPPFAAPPVFRNAVATGSHAGSLAALVENRADIAYLDAVTWRILQAHDPNAGKVHPIGTSIATPGLPLIAALGTDPAPLRRALAATCAAFTPNAPMTMGGPLSFHVLPEQAYHAVPVPKPPRA